MRSTFSIGISHILMFNYTRVYESINIFTVLMKSIDFNHWQQPTILLFMHIFLNAMSALRKLDRVINAA